MVKDVEMTPALLIIATAPSELNVAPSTVPVALRTQYSVRSALLAERDRRPASTCGGSVHAPPPDVGTCHECHGRQPDGIADVPQSE